MGEQNSCWQQCLELATTSHTLKPAQQNAKNNVIPLYQLSFQCVFQMAHSIYSMSQHLKSIIWQILIGYSKYPSNRKQGKKVYTESKLKHSYWKFIKFSAERPNQIVCGILFDL